MGDAAKFLVSVDHSGINIDTAEVGRPHSDSVRMRNTLMERVVKDSRAVKRMVERKSPDYPDTYGAEVFGNMETLYDEGSFLETLYDFVTAVVDFPDAVPAPMGMLREDWSYEVEKVFASHKYPRRQADIRWDIDYETPSFHDVTDDTIRLHMPFLRTYSKDTRANCLVSYGKGDVSTASFYKELTSRFPSMGKIEVVESEGEVPPALSSTFDTMEEFFECTGFSPAAYEAAAVQALLYERYGALTVID